MSLESRFPTRPSSDDKASLAPPTKRISNSVDEDALARLLNRCHNDLIFMDSILSELEDVSQYADDLQNCGADQATAIKGTCRSQPMDPTMAQIGAASVHRIADDIEELYRNADHSEVQAMLSNLQSKMTYCLKLLPAKTELPSAASDQPVR
jgi:hypothetical protein